MARRRDDLTALPNRKAGGQPGSRPQIYDWENWTDGSIWELRQGEDFTVSVHSFRTQLGHTARRYNLTVESRWDAETGIMLVQYRDVT